MRGAGRVIREGERVVLLFIIIPVSPSHSDPSASSSSTSFYSSRSDSDCHIEMDLFEL